MRELLSAHPNVYITHEPWFYIWNSLAPKEMSGDEFLDAYFHTFSFHWLRMRPSDIRKELASPLARSEVRLAFREIMRQKAAAAGRIRYGEKTPGHTDHLADIYRDFPDAKVIVMIRDPRSTVDSTQKMVWGSQVDLANCIAYEIGRKRVEPFTDRVMLVKLEDLLRDPEAKMRQVLDFVDEPWNTAVLDHATHNPWPGDMPPVPWLRSASEPLVGTEVRLPRMAPERIRLIETVCRASMKRYGYDAVKLDNPPSTLSTAARIASETPETLRYLWKVISLFKRLRDQTKWREYTVYVRMYKELNPRWWIDNKDLEVPLPPDWPEEPVFPQSRSHAS